MELYEIKEIKKEMHWIKNLSLQLIKSNINF